MHLELFMVKNERLPLRVSAFLWNIMKDYTLIVKLVLDPGKRILGESVMYIRPKVKDYLMMFNHFWNTKINRVMETI